MYRSLKNTILYSFLIIALSGSPASSFSNNQVRVDQFKWMQFETEHFIVHYDQESADMVPYAARYLEQAWDQVGKTLDFPVKDKTPFFFFSNHNEFEQTNIVPIGEGTGGVTEAFKNRFLIFNDGSQTWMKHVIFHEYGHVVQFNVLYGGWWKSIRLLKSPFYPLWLMEGMAEYVSGDIDQTMGDMMVRDAVANGKLPRLPELQGFGHLKPNQVTLAYKTGEAAIEFLADEFGPDKVGTFLKTIKEYFDVSAGLHELLGTDLERFDFRFQEYMIDKYQDFLKRAQPPSSYGTQLTFSDGIPQTNEAPVISPDGQKIYFVSDRKGPAYIYELDLKSGKQSAILKLKWDDFENIHSRGQAMSVSRDGRYLVFAGEKVQRDYLYMFDLENKKLRKIKVPFDQIRHPYFSPIQDQLVCVGMVNGVNNLYLIDYEGNLLESLTDTIQDEAGPVFSPDGTQIVFSGEVMDSEKVNPIGRDLFQINLETKETKQLTSLLGGELEPVVMNDGSIVFVRDMDDQGEWGFNLFKLNPDSGQVSQLTDLIGGGFSPRVSRRDGELYFVGYNDGERHIYKYSDEKLNEKDENWEQVSDEKELENLSTILERGPELASSPLLLDSPRPYRFRGSTDLFVPFFFYSTLDGLVFADIWQFSDYLGNHQIQQQMQYASKNEYIDLAMFYTYARFRPRFTVGFRNQQIEEQDVFNQQEKKVEGIGLITYPLDRVRSLIAGVGGSNESESFFDETLDTRIQDRFYVLGYSYDTVTGRYLIPNKGRRFSFTFQQGIETVGGREEYKTGTTQFVQYVPLPRESTLVGRILYGRSTGEDEQVFRLGGVDRVRGLSRGSLQNKKQNAVVSSVESRIRLSYLNWRTKFLFPDFFFKAAYLVMFTDNAFGWDNRQERDAFEARRIINSVGTGISWPTFILQTFQLNLTVTWSKQTNDGTEIWYITVGPRF